jgi:hypothetical protein
VLSLGREKGTFARRSGRLLYFITDTVFSRFTCTPSSDIMDNLLLELNFLLQFLDIVFDVFLVFLYFQIQERIEHLFKLLYFVAGLLLIDFDVIGLFNVNVENPFIYVFVFNVLNVFFFDFFFNHYLNDFDKVLPDIIDDIFSVLTIFLQLDFHESHFIRVYPDDVLDWIV